MTILMHNQKTQQQEQPEENGNVINYYDAARFANQSSIDVRECLSHYTFEDINMDLQILWKFIYQILNLERRVKVVNKDVNNLLVSLML